MAKNLRDRFELEIKKQTKLILPNTDRPLTTPSLSELT